MLESFPVYLESYTENIPLIFGKLQKHMFTNIFCQNRGICIAIAMYIHSVIPMLLKGRSRAAATSKMERFVIIVNGFQPLTIITERPILDVAAALDPPLLLENFLLPLLSLLHKISSSKIDAAK